MLFKRKKPLTFFTRISAYLWPRSGIGRSIEYARHRLGRLPDTPHRLAAGFACGVACSFTPLIGFHFVLSAILSFLVRGNLVASAFGTIAGNPWTFPFIWWVTYLVGSAISGMGAGMNPFSELQFGAILSDPWGVFGPIFAPMLLGAVPLALASWALTYFLLVRFFRFYRAKRLDRIARKRQSKMATPA